MFNYLTSDNAIKQPFLLDEILPRFTSMVLNVLSKIVGQRGLEIKVCCCEYSAAYSCLMYDIWLMQVDNMDSYNFDPKIILKEVGVLFMYWTSQLDCYHCMALH
jgi:hypothetical protein